MGHSEDRIEVVTFDSLIAFRSGISQVLVNANRGIRLYDHDLSETGLESIAAINAMEAVCQRASRPGAVRLLLRDSAYLQKSCPRVMGLLARWSHRLEVAVLRKGTSGTDQPFATSDTNAYVLRFHHDSLRGKMGVSDPMQCARLNAQFDTTWLSAQAGPSATTLGL